MIKIFNNPWIILLSIIIFFIIIKKIYKLLFGQDEEDKTQYNKFQVTPTILPKLASYYIGLN